MTEAQTKPSLLTQMGGVAGMVYAGLPSVVFVIANAAADLRAAVMLGVGAGAGIAGLRLLRREPLQPALSGLLGVAVSAVIAYRTGEAKDFFVVGIWASLLLALVFLASILVRRPLVGVIWSALNGSGQAWPCSAAWASRHWGPHQRTREQPAQLVGSSAAEWRRHQPHTWFCSATSTQRSAGVSDTRVVPAATG